MGVGTTGSGDTDGSSVTRSSSMWLLYIFLNVTLSFPPAVLQGVESDTAVTNAILTCTTM